MYQMIKPKEDNETFDITNQMQQQHNYRWKDTARKPNNRRKKQTLGYKSGYKQDLERYFDDMANQQQQLLLQGYISDGKKCSPEVSHI